MWDSGDEDEKLPKGVERIPLSTLYRWYLYDTHPGTNPNKYNHLFELLPVSDEGHQKESEDSDARLDKIAPLASFLQFYANATSEFVVELNKDTFTRFSGVKDQGEKDHYIEVLKESYSINAYYALVSAFSSAVDLGLVKVHGVQTKVK
jgi:hypothetical protein